MSNTVTAYSRDGTPVEIYTSQMYEIADSYIQSLPDENAIKDSCTFSGMIQAINHELFKHTEKNHELYLANAYQNSQNSILDLSDIDTLDRIFDAYCYLCHKYGQSPTLLEFSYLTSIDKDTISGWINGRSRNGNTNAHMRTAKRWKAICEMALEKRCYQSNSIGAIFGLKASYGWRETAPVTPEIEHAQHDSLEEIAKRHNIDLEELRKQQIKEKYKDAVMPANPDFSEFE